MDISTIADIIKRKKITLAIILLVVLFFFAPVIPVHIVEVRNELVPVEVQTTKVISKPYNETKWVKVYHTSALDPPVEKEEIPLLYHVKGSCTNRIPDYRYSITRMEVHNLDSVAGNFTFFVGMEVKRNSDVEDSNLEGEAQETKKEPIRITAPCYTEECEEESSKPTPTPTETKPTNIVLGEEQTKLIEAGEYAVFSFDEDIDIRQCIFQEVSIPGKTKYTEIGTRNETGQIEFWYEPVNETVYINETAEVNETEYQEKKVERPASVRWPLWKYLTGSRTVETGGSSLLNYTAPPGER